MSKDINGAVMTIMGCGFSGMAIAAACAEDFSTIHGTTRSEQKFHGLETVGIVPILFDGTCNSRVEGALRKTSHLVVSIGPHEAGDPVLLALEKTVRAMPRLEWIGYLSTVGVYGNHDGDWVNEQTICRPVSKRSHQRLDAETSWQRLSTETGIPLSIFRLSGIYGPGRNTFQNITKGKARRLVKPGQVFNRIRREDIGQAVRLAAARRIEGIFNITDDEPAPPQDLVTLACSIMGVEPPAETSFETAELSPMARSFYGENKRVSNRKSKEILGLEYLYPEYRASLAQLWESGQWRG